MSHQAHDGRVSIHSAGFKKRSWSTASRVPPYKFSETCGEAFDPNSSTPQPHRLQPSTPKPGASTPTACNPELRARRFDLPGSAPGPRQLHVSTLRGPRFHPKARRLDPNGSKPRPRKVQPWTLRGPTPNRRAQKKPGGRAVAAAAGQGPGAMGVRRGGVALQACCAQVDAGASARALRAKRADSARRAPLSASPLPDTSSRR